jgi:hypothetical protein
VTTGSVRIVKRPPPAAVQFKAIQQEIVKQLQPVGRAHVNERKAVVANFETDIEFGFEVKTSSAQITLTVNVTNSGTEVSSGFSVGDLWKALDKTGVKSHVITPKRPGGRLAFQAGNYQPKTRPIGRSGGPGRVSGGRPVFAKKVNHPGFPPRKFSEKINARLRKQFEQAIGRGVRQGGKKRR